MAEYIERKALIAKLHRLGFGEHGLVERLLADGVYAVIESIPTSDVTPVKRGRWKRYSTTMMGCSLCGKHTARHKFNFFPNCGAKMDLEE